MIDTEDILRILPQRYPILMIDKVLELEVNKKIIAIKNVSINDEFFQGHFPGRPVMPGILIIESIAQAAIILFYYSKLIGCQDKLLYYLGSVSIKFFKPVVPGDQLKIIVEPIKFMSQAGIVSAKAQIGNTLIAKGELTFSVKKES